MGITNTKEPKRTNKNPENKNKNGATRNPIKTGGGLRQSNVSQFRY